MRNPAVLLLLLLLLPLKGCQVPDLHPFAVATGAMASALTAGFDQVASDFGGAAALDLAPDQQKTLLAQQAALAQETAVSRHALAALDAYANTLVEVAEAGDKGKASIDKVANALSAVAAAFGPGVGTVGALVAKGVQDISGDVQKIRTLKKLEEAVVPADAAVQTAATLLGANLADLARIDSAAGRIVDAHLRGTNQNILQAYADLALRQERADSVAGLLVQFETTAIAFKRAAGDRRRRYQQSLAGQLAALGQTDEEVAALGPFDPKKLRPTLALLSTREDFWRKRADNGISPQFQARYDRLQAQLAANDLQAAQSRRVLQRSAALVKTWAAGHTAMKQAVTNARHSVSFQEIIEDAERLKDFIDALQGPHKS